MWAVSLSFRRNDMAAASVLAPSLPGWEDVDTVPDLLVDRLYRAGEGGAVELTAALSQQQRASLAVYCYRRSHLHRIGLVLAAACDQAALMRVLGTALGSALFVQARENRIALERPSTGQRPKVSLAKASPVRLAFVQEAVDDVDVED
jgi:hypothetical protein